MRAVHIFVVLAILAPITRAEDKPAKQLKITVSKETTYVTGPLDKDGYVDYVAALNELLGKGATAENNANVLMWKAFGPGIPGKGQPAAYFKLLGMDSPPATGDYFIELGTFLRDRLKFIDPQQVSLIEGQSATATMRPCTAKEFPHLAEWITANEKPLELIVEASKRPHYFAPFVPASDKGTAGSTVMLPELQKFRHSSTALAVRAMLRAGDGKLDDAWQDVLACHQMARHAARGGTLIEGLVGNACEAIAQRAAAGILDRPELTARQLTGYLRDLRALSTMPTIADRLAGGERIFYLETITTAARKGAAAVAELLGAANNLPAEQLEIMDIDALLRRSNHYFDRMVVALREKDRGKREAGLDGIETELKTLAMGGIAPGAGETLAQAVGKGIGENNMAQLLPAIRRTQTAPDRIDQGARNLHVAFALVNYQREHKAYPKTLGEVAPKYLDKIPDDLFTGKPSTYRPSDTGFLLYSFGPDGKDDDGRAKGDDPPGDDIAIRIPVPAPKK